jgi:saccharopine dehydrogenase (NADP+, L-glutamate forming)
LKVGVPAGVATKMVLSGIISRKGVIAPMDMEIVEPLMKELKEKYGIYCKEKTIEENTTDPAISLRT